MTKNAGTNKSVSFGNSYLRARTGIESESRFSLVVLYGVHVLILLNPRKLEKLEVDALVASKLDWITRTLGKNLPLKIYLFGSAAQDRMSETPDLDFALVYSKEQDLAVSKSLI
jgi:hypothetical protein